MDNFCFNRRMVKNKNVAVFCGSSDGSSPIYRKEAIKLGKCLKEKNYTLVYGGGSRGLMGAIAESMYNEEGEVIGVLPEIFNIPQVVRKDIYTKLYVKKDMHERKALMYELADAFIIMPGGIGTLDEFFEIFTWKQIGKHKKNIAIFNIDGFYNELLTFLNSVKEKGFVSEEVLSSLIVSDDAYKIVSCLFSKEDELPLKID